MQNNLIDKKIVDQKLAACGISDMEDATIRDIVKVVNMVEAESGEKFIRMEMGVPVVFPSKIPERISALSPSFRLVVYCDCPGRLLFLLRLWDI